LDETINMCHEMIESLKLREYTNQSIRIHWNYICYRSCQNCVLISLLIKLRQFSRFFQNWSKRQKNAKDYFFWWVWGTFHATFDTRKRNYALQVISLWIASLQQQQQQQHKKGFRKKDKLRDTSHFFNHGHFSSH